MARGYAYVGALRAIEEAKLPVGAVLGTEMGAFIGSIYAMEGKFTQFEWAMLKFRDGTFDNAKSVVPEVFRRKTRAKKLEDDLASLFDGKDLSQSKLPLRIALQVKGKGVEVLERGSAAQAVRAAISDPELFGAGEWDGAPAIPAPRAKAELIAQARALNLGPVVMIDATGGRASADADLVITPDLSGIGPRDFRKRTEAAFRGKSAVRKKVAELKHLVGMPTDPEPASASGADAAKGSP
jgi:NTE family protein